MFMFQTLKMLPSHILGLNGELVGVLGFSVAGAVLLLLPFLDRPRPDGSHRAVWRYLALFALLYIVVLTFIGYTVDPTR